MRRPELGTALVFATSGAVQASWMARLPAVRDRLHISLADLGFALLAMGAGTLISMPVAGRLCRRFGSRPVTWVSTVLGGAALIALGSTGTRALGLVLFGFGLACGAWDTAMNVQGVAVETVTRAHHMPRLHGWWSAGTLIGAGAGVLGARAHIPLSVHFVVAALICVPLCALGAVAFVDERQLPTVPNGKAARKAAGRRLLVIAALTLCGATVEGAASDWLAIYLRDVRAVSHAHAAAGYTVFVLAMAVGRFAATGAHNRIGRAATVRLGALLAMAGIVLSVLAPLPLAPYVGAACWGLGICVVFPAALSASGQASGSSDAVAAITTVGYSAGLVAPPLIGTLAQGVGLGPALLGLPVLAAVVVVLAPALGHGPAAQPATVTGSGP